MCQGSATLATPCTEPYFDLSIIGSDLHGSSRSQSTSHIQRNHLPPPKSHSLLIMAQPGAAPRSPDSQFAALRMAAEDLAPVSCPGPSLSALRFCCLLRAQESGSGSTVPRVPRIDVPATETKMKSIFLFLEHIFFFLFGVIGEVAPNVVWHRVAPGPPVGRTGVLSCRPTTQGGRWPLQMCRLSGEDDRWEGCHKEDWRESNTFPEAVKILKAKVVATYHYLWDRFSGLS